MNKLEEICAVKRNEVARLKARFSIQDLEQKAREQTEPRGFRSALDVKSSNGFGLIAEVKKASPSKGLIRKDFQPADHAKAYEAGGAACLSVLTDAPFFQGCESDLIEARAACALPVLRKDFMIDTWQIAEARAMGADAILIIVAALENTQMKEIEDAALSYSMDVLIEVHNAMELERARQLQSRLIGINNRDLKQFVTDLSVTERLVKLATEDALLVSESGIATNADCERLANAGVRCFLVGESLMRQDDVANATRKLLTR